MSQKPRTSQSAKQTNNPNQPTNSNTKNQEAQPKPVSRVPDQKKTGETNESSGVVRSPTPTNTHERVNDNNLVKYS